MRRVIFGASVRGSGGQHEAIGGSSTTIPLITAGSARKHPAHWLAVPEFESEGRAAIEVTQSGDDASGSLLLRRPSSLESSASR